MKLRDLVLAFCLLLPVHAAAQTPGVPCVPIADKVCLPHEDFQRFLTIAVDRQCTDHTQPVFELDSITITTDSDGRVFYSGADPKHPYKLHMIWCSYDIRAEGKVQVVAAKREPPTMGLRFRPKAYLGVLPLRASKTSFGNSVDAGILLDWLYVQWLNLNVSVGFRSVGMGLGADLSTNFGLLVGYAIGWQDPRQNMLTSLYFAF